MDNLAKVTASLNELEKPKFKIEKGMVRVAAQADVALEPELEIWHDDFFEDVDPSMLKGSFDKIFDNFIILYLFKNLNEYLRVSNLQT